MADFEKVYAIKYNTRQAQTAVKRLDKATDKIGNRAKEAGKKFDRFIGGKAVKATGKLNRKLQKTRLTLKSIRGGLDKVSRRLAVASAAFAALGGVAVRNALMLNKSMANVSTLLGDNARDVYVLKEAVQDMAKETGKGTDDLADGLYDVVSALGASTDNVNQLAIAAKASVAGLSTTKEAIGLLTATTKGYGDTSNEAMKKVSDLAFMTVKLGVTTFPELAASMGRVIPLASAMNTSQAELFGTMATLTGVTGGAAEVSTQLASVYSSFLKPSAAMNTAIAEINKRHKEYNFESAGAMMKAMGFRKSLLLLNEAADGNEGKLAKILKRKEALIGALALLGGQSDTYTEKLGKMQDVVGATDEAYKRQTEGINKQGHSWDKTKQRMIVFSQRLGDKLIPILSRLLDKLEPVIKYLEDMDEETMDSWIALGKWTAIMAVATKSLSGLLGVVQAFGTLGSMTAGIGAVNTGLATTATRAGAAGKAMKGFQVSGVLAAAAVGLAIGTMLNDIFFEPHSKGRAKQQTTMESSAVQGQGIAKGGTLPQQQAKLTQLKEEKARFKAEAGNVGAEEFIGGVASAFGIGEAPAKRRRRVQQEQDKAIADLEASVKRGVASEVGRGYQTGQGFYDVAPKGETSTTTNNNVVINVHGGDPRQVERVVKKVIRQEGSGIKNYARGESAAEL